MNNPGYGWVFDLGNRTAARGAHHADVVRLRPPSERDSVDVAIESGSRKMSDLCAIADYIAEAEQHIRQAEALLNAFEETRSNEARRLRACMYIAAMKRLKRMIENHQAAEAEDDAPRPAPILSDAPRFRWWPVPKLAIEPGLFRRRAG